jgi:hypothetical protein
VRADPAALLDPRIFASIPYKRQFLGPFLEFVLSLFALKTSLFCVCLRQKPVCFEFVF